MDVRGKLVELIESARCCGSNSLALPVFCAVLAFCAGVCKITAPKLKSQEGALKCETEAQ